MVSCMSNTRTCSQHSVAAVWNSIGGTLVSDIHGDNRVNRELRSTRSPCQMLDRNPSWLRTEMIVFSMQNLCFSFPFKKGLFGLWAFAFPPHLVGSRPKALRNPLENESAILVLQYAVFCLACPKTVRAYSFTWGNSHSTVPHLKCTFHWILAYWLICRADGVARVVECLPSKPGSARPWVQTPVLPNSDILLLDVCHQQHNWWIPEHSHHSILLLLQ
jgi:hypothetical protein